MWAGRTPVGIFGIRVGGERTGVGGYKNRDLGWWKKSKPVKAYTYPPDEPLDPYLVKAMIFQERRVGNDPNGKLNIMQVGNLGDPSLEFLNNLTKNPEYELKNGKLWRVDYKGVAKVNTVYDSIYWGVSGYTTGHNGLATITNAIGFLGKRRLRYGPGTSEYVENVFNIYLDGVDKRRGESPIKLWLFIFYFQRFSLSCSIINIQLRLPY